MKATNCSFPKHCHMHNREILHMYTTMMVCKHLGEFMDSLRPTHGHPWSPQKPVHELEGHGVKKFGCGKSGE